MAESRAVKKRPEQPAIRRSEGMGGLAKGLAIIEALARRGTLSSAEAARASMTTRAAARRCLLTLVELGYVERIGRTFRPLPRMRSLGRDGGLKEWLATESIDALTRARARLNESCSLAILENDEALFISRVEAAHIVSTGVRVGASLPAYCSASGRVLLSQLSPERLREVLGRKRLPGRTPKTLTKVADLIHEIANVAINGYAISDEELEIGMRSMAVPVMRQGQVVAAVSTSVYSGRVGKAALIGEPLSVLRACASEIEIAAFGDD